MKKLSPGKCAMIQWHTQAGNINIIIKVGVDSTLLALSAANVVTRKWHVDEYAKGRYGIILGRYLLT